MTTLRRALVVIDVQGEYFDGPLTIQYPPTSQTLPNVIAAVRAASEQGIPTVVVQHNLGDGAPAFAPGTPGYDLHPDLAALENPSWKRVDKQCGSVFAGTDVGDWLTEHEVDVISIVGYMTNNCVIATAADADGRGMATEVLADATGAIHLSNSAGTTSAENLHTTLMVLLNSNFATVATTSAWLDATTQGATIDGGSDLFTSAIEGVTANG